MGYARHHEGLQNPLWGGSFAMESAAGFAWNRWQLCRGMAGSFHLESAAGFAWNRWQACRGISGSFRVEYAPDRVKGYFEQTKVDLGLN
jgi:hypothetical protein